MRLIGLIAAGIMAAAHGLEPPAPRQRTRYVPPKPDHDMHMRKAEEKRQRRAAKRLQQNQRRP